MDELISLAKIFGSIIFVLTCIFLLLSLLVKIFSIMEQFAGYGFNKSHSYAYSLVAYQMAYLKANYPLYFYQSLLNSVIGSGIKTSQYIYECK